MEFGVSTWLYEAQPLETAVEKLGRAGFRRIELWGNTHFNPERLRAGDVRSLRRLLGGLGMEVFSLHAPFNLNIADPDRANRRRGAELVGESIRLAAVLRPRVVVVHPGSCAGLESLRAVQAYRRRLRESFRLIVQAAEKYSCCLAVENMTRYRPWTRHKYKFGWSLGQLHELIDARPGDGICLDVGHAAVSGVSIARALADSAVITTHLHDNDGQADIHLLPGKGVINWPRFYSALRARKIRPGLVFEVSGANNPDRVLAELRVLVEKHARQLS